jgi:hypothetical protein
LQQRSDQSAFFGQEPVDADEARVIAGTVFVAVCCQNRRAYGERAGRLDAGYSGLSNCG